MAVLLYDNCRLCILLFYESPSFNEVSFRSWFGFFFEFYG